MKMPSPQQQSQSSGDEPARNTVTSLPASALKHLEPSPGGQWMCREHQGALHVAYNVVGGHGTYHYLINPCTTERQVHENCRTHIYEFPGGEKFVYLWGLGLTGAAQQNHEEIQRYEFPDRFNSTTRATPTMQVILGPQSLALNNGTQTTNISQDSEVKRENRYTENLNPREHEAIAQIPQPRLPQHDSSENAEATIHNLGTLPEQIVQVFPTDFPASESGKWSFEDEMTQPASTTLPSQPLPTALPNTNHLYTDSTLLGAWDTVGESNNAGTEFGWLMNVTE
ncbi:hypothetical protein HJFPF1_05127 [Paramyrothecium foliicola]|nr:hypothetical protein HJFPF1_05127 [Paramyrothecium foliicola]